MLRIRPLLVCTATLGILVAACSGGADGNGATDDAGTVDGTDSGGGGGTIDGSTSGGGKDAGSGGNKDAGSAGCSPNCAKGDACKADSDCTSKACSVDGKCATGATDGKVDFGESDIDCGGATKDMASKCALGKTCATNADCLNGNCGTGKTCSTPGAMDGLQDFGESDIDCGGNTTDGAPKCASGKMCVKDNDCTSAACSAGLVCATGATDGKKDFGESDIDCGGDTTDMAPKCDLGFVCALSNDCTSTFCSAGLVCVANGYTDGKKDFGESDIDCGGHSLDGAPLCADTYACVDGNDCLSTYCNPSNKCATPTSNDGIRNGTETDVDCGGGAPTNAPACPPGKKCVIGTDCTVGGCNYKGICPTAISCTGQYGGDTCGPEIAPEDCCATLPAAGLPAGSINGVAVPTSTIDKYNITAGRLRAFAIATNGDFRTWIANHKPAWWNDSWTPWLPTELDDGGSNPACCGAVVANDNVCTTAGNVGEACGLYQELGPNVHGQSSVGANEGCVIRNYGARTYRLPDALNARMADIQTYSIAESDQRSLQCVTSYIQAAFCAWDGGHLPTTGQEDYLWHGTTYPWGVNVNPAWAGAPTPPAYSGTSTPPSTSGAPAGYLFGNDVDPQGGKRGTQPTYGTVAYGQYAIGGGGQPLGGMAGAVTAVQLADLQWANYNANYWGGLSQTHVGFCNSSAKYCIEGSACAGAAGNKCPISAADQSLFVAPPGRFPNGNGFYKHSDLAGNVFNALDMQGAANGNTQWSRSGSWQGHPIPWPGRVNVPSYYKYWAMGGRCAR